MASRDTIGSAATPASGDGAGESIVFAFAAAVVTNKNSNSITAKINELVNPAIASAYLFVEIYR